MAYRDALSLPDCPHPCPRCGCPLVWLGRDVAAGADPARVILRVHTFGRGRGFRNDTRASRLRCPRGHEWWIIYHDHACETI